MFGSSENKAKEFKQECDKMVVDSWDKVYAVFDDYMSDIEFMPKEQVTNEIQMIYRAMLYTNNQIKHWRLELPPLTK